MSEPVLGIDLGSRTTKILALRGGQVESFQIFDTDHDPVARVRDALKDLTFSAVVATGYGRHLLKAHFADGVVTEIKACARGAKYLCPECATVIDVGGQDSKVIEVTSDGGFANFEMNDRCAAGTGKFLEVMASTLGYDIEGFWRAALEAESPVAISSMCTVFAESEVVSLITSGADVKSVALGLHQAIADRLYALACRVELKGEVLLAGGVAKNNCVRQLLEKRLQRRMVVPDNPQMVSALGAALIANENALARGTGR